MVTDARLVTRLTELRISASTALRTASVITLLFAAGHTPGGLQSWSPARQTCFRRCERFVLMLTASAEVTGTSTCVALREVTRLVCCQGPNREEMAALRASAAAS